MPAGTPKAIRDEVHAAVSQALAAPDVRTRFESLGYVPGDNDPQSLRKKVNDDFAKWKRVIEAARISIE